MHAVVTEVKVDPSREEEARKLLHDVVVPQAKQFDGFVAGTWLRAISGDRGVYYLHGWPLPSAPFRPWTLLTGGQ
jgi:hypothetical protein